ncbi:MAG: alpha/beta fold hydrolase [Novosphingobium sp.]
MRTRFGRYCPQGAARQMSGVFGDCDRCKRLAGVTIPTLLIHGEDDPLIPVEGGSDNVAAIPGAEIVEIQSLGHAK